MHRSASRGAAPRQAPALAFAPPAIVLPSFVLPAVLCLVLAPAAQADDEPALGWSDRAEVGLVAVDGNSESTSLGLKNELDYDWPRATFSFDVSAVRAESTTTDRTAVVSADDGFVVEEESTTDVTAENYLAKLRYEHDLSEQVFWHVGASWEKDEPAGIDQRLVGVVGAGYVVWDTEDERLLKFDGGLTYTQEETVLDDTFEDDESFLGARLSWEWMRRLTPSTQVGNDTTFDQNLDDTADLRVDTSTWLSVKMSERLALKTSLQLKYDAEPALTAVDLFDTDGTDTGRDVLVELDELDTVLKLTLVVDF